MSRLCFAFSLPRREAKDLIGWTGTLCQMESISKVIFQNQATNVIAWFCGGEVLWHTTKPEYSIGAPVRGVGVPIFEMVKTVVLKQCEILWHCCVCHPLGHHTFVLESFNDRGEFWFKGAPVAGCPASGIAICVPWSLCEIVDG